MGNKLKSSILRKRAKKLQDREAAAAARSETTKLQTLRDEGYIEVLLEKEESRHWDNAYWDTETYTVYTGLANTRSISLVCKKEYLESRVAKTILNPKNIEFLPREGEKPYIMIYEESGFRICKTFTRGWALARLL
jgi:hypothetical protein